MPTWMENPNLPGRYGGEVAGNPTIEQCDEMYPDHAHMKNARYSRLMGDYLACVNVYLHTFPFVE